MKLKNQDGDDLIKRYDRNLTFIKNFYPGSKMPPPDLVGFLSTQSIEQKLISDGLVEGGNKEFDPCTTTDYSTMIPGGSTARKRRQTQTAGTAGITEICPKGAKLFQSAQRCFDLYNQEVDYNGAVGTCIKKNALNFLAFNNSDLFFLKDIIKGGK